MIKIGQILLDQMTEDDRKWLERGCLGAWDKATAVDQLDAVRANSAWLFRISGEATGVFVLAIANKQERVLCITAMAGKDILRHFGEIYKQVRELCRSRGARKLVGWVQRPGLAETYKSKTKAVQTAVAFIEDLET